MSSGLAGSTNYAVLASFMQDVYPQKPARAGGDSSRIDKITWEKNANGSTMNAPLINDNILNSIDLFLRDCLAVNAIEKDKNQKKGTGKNIKI